MSRADVLASFSESAENIANTDPLIELGVGLSALWRCISNAVAFSARCDDF